MSDLDKAVAEIKEVSDLQQRYPFVQHLQNKPVTGCPFYGKNGMAGVLVDTHGNQCGLILDRHAPCIMEPSPDVTVCRLVTIAKRQAILIHDQGIFIPDDRPW